MLTPRFQLKLTFYFIVTGIVILVSTLSMVYMKMVAIRTLMNTAILTDFSIQSQINSLMYEVAIVSMVGFALFAAASFIFALMISHRIAGPVFAIRTYIEDLKNGDYGSSRGLRPNDELTTIMDSLHELGASLREKHKQ